MQVLFGNAKDFSLRFSLLKEHPGCEGLYGAGTDAEKLVRKQLQQSRQKLGGL